MMPEVLLIEDEITADVVKLIKDAKKENLNILALRTEDALEKVNADFYNQISVLIVDFTHKYNPDIPKPINPEYYLDESYHYEKQNEEDLIYNMQGFTFIEEALKTNRKYKFIAYTNCPRSFLIEVNKELNLDIENDVNKEFFNSEDGRKNAITYLKEQIRLNRNSVLLVDTFKDQLSIFLTWFYGLPESQRNDFEIEITEKAKSHIQKFNSLVSTADDLMQIDNSFNIYKDNQNDFSIQSSKVSGYKTEDRLYIERISKIVDVLKHLKENAIVDINSILLNLSESSENSKNQAKRDFITLSQDIQIITINFLKEKKNKQSQYLAEDIFNEINNKGLIVNLKSSVKLENKKTIDFSDHSIIEIYKKRIIIRRFAIFLYYWLELKKSKPPYGKLINRLIVNGTLKKPINEPFPVTSSSLYLSQKNKNIKNISKLIDIAFTKEEEDFFQVNYPDLYNKWK